MTDAFINRIATALPPHDVHEGFLDFGRRMLEDDNRRLALFNRMVERSGISHRYSNFEPEGEGDAAHFYRPGAFPGTGERMKLFENFAPDLATEAAERLLAGEDRGRITHLIVTCCTGFFAPGIDLQLVERCDEGLCDEAPAVLAEVPACVWAGYERRGPRFGRANGVHEERPGRSTDVGPRDFHKKRAQPLMVLDARGGLDT